MRHKFTTETVKGTEKQWQVFFSKAYDSVLVCVRDLSNNEEWEICSFNEDGELVLSEGIPDESGLPVDSAGRIITKNED